MMDSLRGGVVGERAEGDDGKSGDGKEGNVTIPDDDSLDSKYWLNVDIRKYCCYLLS